MEEKYHARKQTRDLLPVFTKPQKLLLGSLFLLLFTGFLSGQSVGDSGIKAELEWINLLLIPFLYYLAKLERKIERGLTILEGHDRRLKLLEKTND